MLPVETISAVFPPKAEIKGTRITWGFIPRAIRYTLRPMTLLHATLMEILGVSLGETKIDRNVAMTAAWVLTMNPEETRRIASMETKETMQRFWRWAKTVREKPSELIRKVNQCVDLAFLPCVPGKQMSNVKIQQGPSGYGWPLEIAESIAAEHGLKLDQALETPMTQAFGILACARQRNSGEAGGPDYYERITIEKMREEKRKGR